MSSYSKAPGGQDNSQHLDDLLSRLNSQRNPSNSNVRDNSNALENTNPYFTQSQNIGSNYYDGYREPTVSSAIPTPPISSYNQPPRHGSAIMSPASDYPAPSMATNGNASRNITPMARTASGGASGGADRTASLLKLLKFSGPTSASSNLSPQPPVNVPHITRNTSGSQTSDLLATLMSSSQSQENKPSPLTSTPVTPLTASADTQSYLMQLLNRAKPSQTDTPSDSEPQLIAKASRTSSRNDVQDLTQSLEQTTLENKVEAPSAQPSNAAPSQGLFTYVNPFEELARSSPRNGPAATTNVVAPTPVAQPLQILKRQAQPASSELKRKVDDRTPSSSPALSAKRKTESNIPQPPSPTIDHRLEQQFMLSTRSSRKGKEKETVAEALNDVGDQVDRQVEEALARAELDQTQAMITHDMQNLMNSKTDAEFKENAKIAANDIKKELDKEGNENVLEEEYSQPMAQAIKKLVSKTAKGDIADDWETASAGDSPKKDGLGALTPVFELPRIAFQDITVLADKIDADYQTPNFRPEAFMDVARVKKDFDQIDRTLVDASKEFIAYAMSKSGGIRIIRQHDGQDLKLFTQTQDRVFNVSICDSTIDSTETVLGTGVSGTVYWAKIKDVTGDFVESEDPEQLGFALPPFKAFGEESSGGVVKTRARKSFNHPEFFAVGRGKSIHIIWPAVIMKQGYLKAETGRVVDVEKYLNHRSLKINTGKAGKDFSFSPDDSTIVSLDKAGRVKFWDVRTLTQTDRSTESRFPAPEQICPIEIAEPMMTLATTHSNEKSWPTSVMFIDKDRPYRKLGNPLRFLIVGMKQNHTLQLWDLVLNKIVQEIHLPHTKESDAVCSVVYHPKTGMVVVGHPTRNSIYLMQLSVPMYHAYNSKSQAEFITKLASKDTTFARPESTCILRSIREYSLSPKGQLRSLELLPAPISADLNNPDPTIFELYAIHSKGVSVIYIIQDDLGLKSDNIPVRAIDALKSGLISTKPLVQLPQPEATMSPASSARAITRIAAKDASPKEVLQRSLLVNGKAPETPGGAGRAEIKAESPQTPATVTSQSSGVLVSPEKLDKKKKKKLANASKLVESQAAETLSATAIVLEPRASDVGSAAGNAMIEATKEAPPLEAASLSTIPAASSTTTPGRPVAENGSSNKQTSDDAVAEFSGRLEGSFDALYRRLDNDQRAQTAVFDSKQEALLRLVSSTLSENVEGALSGIVSSQIKKSVVPNLSQVISQSVKENLKGTVDSHLKEDLLPTIGPHFDRLGAAITAQLKTAIPKELNSILPGAVSNSMQKPEIIKLISDSVVKNITQRIQNELTLMMQTTIMPAFQDLAVRAARDATQEAALQTTQMISEVERNRQADSLKLEQAVRLISGMGEMLATMASSQRDFQEKNLRMIQKYQADTHHQDNSARGAGSAAAGNTHRSRQLGNAAATSGPVQPVKSASDSSLEVLVAGLSRLMQEAKYESAILQWLRSDRQQDVFEAYFSQYEPQFLQDLSPLISLSVAATVSENLNGIYLAQRLAYIDFISSNFRVTVEKNEVDAQTLEVLPRIKSIISHRLDTVLMALKAANPRDERLKLISNTLVLIRAFDVPARR